MMTRLSSGLALKTAALILLGCLVTITSATARHRRSASEGEPGAFDYYLLSLSWSPAFCLEKPGAAECNGPRRFGFIVHGLWPQYEKGWPENCNVPQRVPDNVVTGISDLMPARGLVYHEWSAHGTCSGLSPAEFFALIRRARGSVAIPTALVETSQAVEESPAAIRAAIQSANPKLPAQAIVVTCSGQESPRLREVHVCFDRDLNPRACSADAARRSCRAPTLIVPPIR
jgi:ribonuclease T2